MDIPASLNFIKQFVRYIPWRSEIVRKIIWKKNPGYFYVVFFDIILANYMDPVIKQPGFNGIREVGFFRGSLVNLDEFRKQLVTVSG